MEVRHKGTKPHQVDEHGLLWVWVVVHLKVCQPVRASLRGRPSLRRLIAAVS